MHITSISYTESESIESFVDGGLRQWNKREQSVTVSLNDNDDPNKADELAKQFVKEKLKAKQPMQPQEIYTAAGEKPMPVIQTEKIGRGFDNYLEEINKCQTQLELETMRIIADMNPKLKDAFLLKMKQFQKQAIIEIMDADAKDGLY